MDTILDRIVGAAFAVFAFLVAIFWLRLILCAADMLR